MAKNKKDPIVIMIAPSLDGKFILSTNDERSSICFSNRTVSDLYVAMEANDIIESQVFTESVLYKIYCAIAGEGIPLVYNIKVTAAGQYYIYTDNKEFIRSYDYAAITVDNLYVAMKGLSLKYGNNYDISFRIENSVY